MEPKSQVEIQLGHMCNNRCVFCVSGQRTAMGEAGPLPVEPILRELASARAAGHRKLTLLGGEPTLQPSFLEVVRHAVSLGFDEIVVFTNGVKTARPGFIDEVLETGGKFTWRFSMQGGTEEAHERTTRRDGSFGRIVRSMQALRERGQRITVNMCVVGSNYESVSRFADLLVPMGAVELHLDMVRPADSGDRTEEELRALMPRYSDMVRPLEEMVGGFLRAEAAGALPVDVNIGNYPYCLAPRLARFIHHDGERTMTIAIDGDRELSQPWDKYLVKRRDKVKPASCGTCVFDARCNGIFETYRRFHGDGELVPVTPARLRDVDPGFEHLSLHLVPLAARLREAGLPEPFVGLEAKETSDAEVVMTLFAPSGARLTVALGRPRVGSAASFGWFGLTLLEAPRDRAVAASALRALVARLAEHGERVVWPAGDDALGTLSRSVAVRLHRMRRRAPFGRLDWKDVVVSDGGARAEAIFAAPGGERVTVWLGEKAGRAAGGYVLGSDAPSAEVREALGAVMEALRGSGADLSVPG